MPDNTPNNTHAPKPSAASPDELSLIADFLNRIGISAEVVDEPLHGFLEGVVIKQGTMRIGPNAKVDGVLHEAGHLATTPKPFRSWMNDNLSAGQKKAVDAMTRLGIHPESNLGRHALQFSDTEATAWAYAAGKALGFDDEVIIPNEAYDGEGASIRAMCQKGQYLGVNGLAAAGMCDFGLAAKVRGNPAYPAMMRWTQDGPYPELDGADLEGGKARAPGRRMSP